RGRVRWGRHRQAHRSQSRPADCDRRWLQHRPLSPRQAMTVVIINPVSGSARRGTAKERIGMATAALAAVGMRAEIVLTTSEGHAYELARQAVAQQADLVIAWGGDGTINEVGRALAFTGTAM